MNLIENISMAMESIYTNKIRALLTMLGVIIGIASVIGILTIGEGLSSSITGEFGELGATNITIYVEERSEAAQYSNRRGYAVSIPESSRLTDDMIATLETEFESSIESIARTESLGSTTFDDGTSASVSGVTTTQFNNATSSLELILGRNFLERDFQNTTKTAILSNSLLNTLIENEYTTGIGDDFMITLSNRLFVFDIIGAYDDSENETEQIYIPVDTAKQISSSSSGYQQITVIATKDADVYALADELADYLNHYYTHDEQYHVNASTMQSIIDSMNQMMGTISVALSAIAGISLLVGGIGVMNIMLVTVTERTKEIGTRKAVGATGRQIQIQFVTEGAIICGIGGMFGILLGTALGYAGSSLLGNGVLPSVQNIFLATGISLAIGIFFSYSPAKKAANLNPIEALRYE